MSYHLSPLNEEILDTFSHSEDCFFLIAYPQENVCHWTKNSLSCFNLDGKDMPLSYLWDSLLHPDDREIFRAKYQFLFCGQTHVTGEYRLMRRNGNYQQYQCDFWRLSSECNDLDVCLAGRITDSDGLQMSDPVTSLPSNFDFSRTLDNLIAQKLCGIVLMIGIDNFKTFNEMYSYAFGNHVLCLCAAVIRRMLPLHCSLFRSDGDGFFILSAPREVSEVQEWFLQVQKALQRPQLVDGITVNFTISAGMCSFPKDGDNTDEIYRIATLTLQSAKADGKNRLVCYSNELEAKYGIQSRLLAHLRESIAQGFKYFSVYYQPLVLAETGELTGCEALLRWRHPDFLDIPIETCVNCLEESGLIIELGEWILRTAVKQCAKWVRFAPHFCININVACQQFEKPDFQFTVMNILNEYHVDPENIILELTESGRVQNAEKVGQVFDFLRSQRIRIAFDDFGTGYASLDIFRKLSADELKIDRSFLERITYNITDQALVTTLINLCHKMNMLVCVEGIESAELENIIRQMKPDFLQGYYYDLPLTANAFETKYFLELTSHLSSTPSKIQPELKNSMAYSPFVPAQPLVMDDIINHAYAGIFQTGLDQEFTFLTCNEGYRRMLGYTSTEIDRKFKNRALGFVHPDDITYVNEEIRRQLGEGDTVTIEFRIVRKDNTPIWIVGTGNVYHSPNGSSSLIIVIIDNDKAKRRQLEQMKKFEYYRKVLNNLPTGVKMVHNDSDFTIDYISPGFLDMMGYTEEEIQTRFDGKYINLIYPDDRETVFNDIVTQLKKSDIVTMRYRTICKDGTLPWVETVSRLCPPDADGIERACSSVVDVSQITAASPAANNRALNIAARYETAVYQWGEFLFELNYKTNHFNFSQNFLKLFCIEPHQELSDILMLIYEEDRNAFMSALKQCSLGITPDAMDLRLNLPGGTQRWFSLVFSSPEKLGDVVVSVLGKFTDVDKEKREHERLVMQVRHDSLTGLYTKSATESMIREQLSAYPDLRYALFMLDVDGFKHINDRIGHFSGDVILRQLSDTLRSLFRQTDIVGRVGGDEFMIFITCGDEEETVIEKAERILKTVHQKAFLPEETGMSLTLSIGISRCPENGTNFYDLFRNADSALYRAKELGHDRYCLSSI